MSKADVFEHYKNSNNGLSTAISHISVMTAAPDLQVIRRLVAEHKPHLLVVDTTDCIIPPRRNEELAEENSVARGLKDIAQTQDTIIIGVHHISKFAATQGKLNIHSGKGSSAFEQKADKVISIEGNVDSSLRTITSLGARDEASFKLLVDIDWNTFRFKQVSPSTATKRGLLLQ
jgi:predicted ATP-dependent serine protease